LCKIHGTKGTPTSVQNTAKKEFKKNSKRVSFKDKKSKNHGFTGEKLKSTSFRDMFRRR